MARDDTPRITCLFKRFILFFWTGFLRSKKRGVERKGAKNVPRLDALLDVPGFDRVASAEAAEVWGPSVASIRFASTESYHSLSLSLSMGLSWWCIGKADANGRDLPSNRIAKKKYLSSPPRSVLFFSVMSLRRNHDIYNSGEFGPSQPASWLDTYIYIYKKKIKR